MIEKVGRAILITAIIILIIIIKETLKQEKYTNIVGIKRIIAQRYYTRKI